MTKAQFLNRCNTAWTAGLIRPSTLKLLDQWIDMVMRLEGGQLDMFSDLLDSESRRTGGFTMKLANDRDGYDIVQLSAILNHPCQQCAEDTKAWWTRTAFCQHKKRS